MRCVFFHIADVHLGASPDAGFPWSEERKNEIWDSFCNVIYAVRGGKTRTAADRWRPVPQTAAAAGIKRGGLSVFYNSADNGSDDSRQP